MLGTRRCRLLTADLFLLFHSILAPRHSTLPRSGPQSAISPIDLPPAHCYTHSPEGGSIGTAGLLGHSERVTASPDDRWSDGGVTRLAASD